MNNYLIRSSKTLHSIDYMWKLFIMLSILGILGSSYFSYDLYQKNNKIINPSIYEKLKNLDLTVNSKKKELEDSYIKLKASIFQGVQAKGKLDIENEKIATAKEAKESVEQEYNTQQDKLERLQSQAADFQEFDKFRTQMQEVDIEHQSAKTKLASANNQLKKYENIITGKNKHLNNLENLRKSQTSGLPAPNFYAKVSKAYPYWGFVTINKGVYQGVVPQSQLGVFRRNKQIGKVKIRTVEQNSSTADVINSSGAISYDFDIKPGDTIKPLNISKSNNTNETSSQKLDKLIKEKSKNKENKPSENRSEDTSTTNEDSNSSETSTENKTDDTTTSEDLPVDDSSLDDSLNEGDDDDAIFGE